MWSVSHFKYPIYPIYQVSHLCYLRVTHMHATYAFTQTFISTLLLQAYLTKSGHTEPQLQEWTHLSGL